MKTVRYRVICFILSLIFVLSSVMVGFTASAVVNVGDIVTYGSYPQTEVTDAETTASLNGKLTEDCWTSYGYYSGDGTIGSENNNTDFMYYTDVYLAGYKYRGVKFTQYRPEKSYTAFPESASSQRGQAGKSLNTVYWFRYEPVRWIVVDSDTNLAISEKVLDGQCFNNIYKDTSNSSFEGSFLQSMLQGSFSVTAFGSENKSVCILDEEELDSAFSTAEKQLSFATDYAKINNVQNQKIKVSGSYVSGYSSYWVNGEYNNTNSKAYKNGLGIRFSEVTNVDGVRPAVTLDENKCNKYTITFIYDGKTVKQTLNAGEAVIAPEINAKTGYDFEWDGNIPSVMPENDLTFFGEYVPHRHDVTWNADGGMFSDGKATKTDSVAYDSAITYETPVKQGYVFDGWDSEIPDKMPDNELSFTAKWKPSDNTVYTIKIHTQNTDGTYYENMYDAVYKTGTTDSVVSFDIKDAENIVDTDHFTLDESKGTLSDTVTPDGKMYLEVYFKRNAYTITYNYNDGKTENLKKDCLYGAFIPLVDVPEREGYTSYGWSIPESAICTGDCEFKLNWSKNSYTIHWMIGGKEMKTFVYFGDEIIAPAVASNTGYEFKGWDSIIPESMPSHDLTFTAIIEKKLFKVTWIADGYTSETYCYAGDNITVQNATARDGYTFSWSTIPEVMPATDVTIYGTYKLIPKASIAKYSENITIDYKKTVKYHATVSGEEGTKLVWVYNGKEIADDGSGTFEVNAPQSNYTIGAKAVCGDESSDILIQNIKVKNSFFFDKIVWFFRSIFSSSKLYEDRI